MNRNDFNPIEMLGGEMLFDSADKRLAEFFLNMMTTPIGESSDFEGYLYVTNHLIKMGISHHPHSPNGEIIVQFTNWISDEFPATTAAIAGHFAQSFAYQRNNYWSTRLINNLMEKGIHHSYQVSAIADLLEHRSASDSIDSGKKAYSHNLLLLSIMGLESLDRFQLNDNYKNLLREKLEESLKNSLILMSMDDYLSISYANLSTDKDSLESRSINRLSQIFEERNQKQFLWFESYYKSTFYVMNKYLENSIQKRNAYPNLRFFSAEVSNSNIISALKGSMQGWMSVLKGSGEKKHDRIKNIHTGIRNIHDSLILNGADQGQVREAFTAFATPLLQTLFEAKLNVDHADHKNRLITYLIKKSDVPVVLNSLKPGARTMFVEHIIRHNQEFVEHLKPNERARLLDSSLGL